MGSVFQFSYLTVYKTSSTNHSKVPSVEVYRHSPSELNLH